MKSFAKNFYYSFPIQLLLLHFRKSQLVLLFWVILFLTVTGHMMKLFGADALFLAPEYLGNVNPVGSAIIGTATAIYIMSWNITTFILHSRRFRFLATTTKPFLKYCLNNSIIPLVFLIVYFTKALQYITQNELISVGRFFLIAGGFMAGFIILTLVSFAYFFTADLRIVRTFKPGFLDAEENKLNDGVTETERFDLPVGLYFNSRFQLKKSRTVRHYSQFFLDEIFKRHHFSAMITVLLAFIFMIVISLFLEDKIFQVPAAASVLILFAILVAVMGALSYFLGSWTLLFIIIIFLILNLLYHFNIIDPRNKAYGMEYDNKERPAYSLSYLQSLNTPDKLLADKNNMIGILNRWKQKQPEEKPLMILFNFSGGGLRGASFSMNVLQELDKATNGTILQKTMLMSGASGGMLAAAYFRELDRLKQNGEKINLQNKKYLNNISEDLLNPVFSSMITQDLLAPVQKFTYKGNRYIKDRGYAFEQKLNKNTGGVLDKNIGFFKEAEYNAEIPLMILNSVITRDFKKLMVSTQPISFMMQEAYHDNTSSITGPDAIDFGAFFKNENPMNLRMLTALRMNATYPYVLPAVWLPSNPVIDVMDAGLRDNNGQETSLRFLHVFKDWINANTRGVLIIQVRSRQKGSWDNSYEKGGIEQVVIKPFSMLQTNWFILQDYFQDDEITYAQSFLDSPLQRVAFMYIPEKQQLGASLNFHLTANEKKEVHTSLQRTNNKEAFRRVQEIISHKSR